MSALMSLPESQFGKIMSLPDELILTYFRLVTRWNPEQIADMEAGLNEEPNSSNDGQKTTGN